MPNMNTHEPSDKGLSKTVLEMLTVANEYCLFFEQAERHETHDILVFFQKIAPLLYLKASLLEMVPANHDAGNERYVTEEEWEAIFKTLRKKFGKNDIYYVHDHNFDSVEASLSDNMADIYQDMKDFVLLLQKNTTPARHNAVANIIDLFKHRWGIALINALGAIHHILYKEEINPDLLQNDKEWLF